jgi:hypothetical protein
VVVRGSLLYALNATTGEPRRAFQSREERVAFVSASGRNEVVSLSPDWDTSRWSLCGLSEGPTDGRRGADKGPLEGRRGADKARRIWSYAVHGKSMSGTIRMADWTVVSVKEHLILIQTLGSSNRLTVDRISALSGIADSHEETMLDGASYPALGTVLRDDSQIVVARPGRLIRINLETGKIR